MKKVVALALAAALFGGAAGAYLGEVLASWQTPWPHRGVNGIAYDGEYIWVKNNVSWGGWVFKCTTTGSVVTEIAFPFSPTIYSYGLAFDGEYLWTVHQFYVGPVDQDIYSKYTTNGSYANGFRQHEAYFGSLGIAWDGEYLYTDETLTCRNQFKYTTVGSLVATFPMTVRVCSDMAYYKRQLWYCNTYLIYGVTLNGSVVASFQPPGGSCAGTAFDGEYLWTVDKNRPQYIYKVDIDVVGVAPASAGRVKALFR